MPKLPGRTHCPNWVDSQCDLPDNHDGPCYSNADDIIWREPDDDERHAFRSMLSEVSDA